MTDFYEKATDFSLPAISLENNGWPWKPDWPIFSTHTATENLPKISVITPSFGQGKYIEQTIRSVLLQNYPSLEYIIIDGGSEDNTVEAIRKYSPWLKYWSSERDRGQSHAINKGLSFATGEIICWLNSDDYFLPYTLFLVAETLAQGSNNYALVGHCIRIQEFDEHAIPVLLSGSFKNDIGLLKFWKGYQMHQPAIFWRREVFEKVGWIKEDLHLTMDFDYWARIARNFRFVTLNKALSCSNFHASAKTGDDYQTYHLELRKNVRAYWGSKLSFTFWKLQTSFFIHYKLAPLVSRLKDCLKFLLFVK